jgi:SSS family solute:Na+ symporter
MESAVLSCGWWSSASSLSDIPCSAAQYANIRTDVLDVVIVFVGIFTGLGVLLWQMGGINGLINALPADKLSFPLSSNFGGSDLVSYLLLVGLTYVVGPDMYSRLFCARDGRTAKISVFWAALFLIPIALAITLIGMGAFALQPDILPEQAFPVLITGILPTLAAGVVLAALVSAIMSTADATLLSAGTILSMDIIGHFRKSDNQQLSLRHSQIAILLIGLASLGLALMLKGLLRPYYSPTPSIPAG